MLGSILNVVINCINKLVKSRSINNLNLMQEHSLKVVKEGFDWGKSRG
jgi:hypothetical protein